MRLFIKHLIFFCLIYLYSSTVVIAQDLKILDIKVIGNNYISEQKVLNLGNLEKKNFFINLDQLNEIQKKIFASNFFSKVDLIVRNNILNINVSENPIVDYFIIEGIDNFGDHKKKILENIQIKDNSIFSETFLNNDIIYIKNYFKSLGFLKVDVEYKVNKLINNRVNVFFKIILNNKFLIKNIFFIGDKNFSSADLQSQISSREDSWLSLFNNASVPSLERLDFDVSTLKNFYLSEGFYDVQISSASIEILNDKEVNIIFSITSGKKFTFINNKLTINSTSLDKNYFLVLDEIIKKLDNQQYSNKKIQELLDYYNNFFDKQSINVNVNFAIKKESDDKLSLSLFIDELKNRLILRDIKIIGNDITEEKVIRNNLFFVEGDIFNNYKLNKSEDELKSLGIFKKVNITTSKDEKEQKIDIVISIEEKPTGEIAAGAGIGTAGSTLNFNLREKNFLGQGINTDISTSIGTQRVLGNISFSNPDFRDTGNTLRSSNFISKYTYEDAGYQNKLIGSNLSQNYLVYENITFENGIGISLDSIDVDSDASSLILTQEGNFFTTKLFYSFFNDKRDQKYRPTSGYTLFFGQDFALAPSDIPFISNTLSGSIYKKLGDNFNGSIRYKVKTINSLNGSSIKLSDRVFLTDSEMRGFSYRGIGPKVDKDYIGGNYSYVTSFSTTFPNGIPDSWKTTSNIFLDIGSVWGSDISNVADFNTVRSSIGLGFTWDSPIGPIGLSYAEPISKSSTDDVEKFNFRLGGVF